MYKRPLFFTSFVFFPFVSLLTLHGCSDDDGNTTSTVPEASTTLLTVSVPASRLEHNESGNGETSYIFISDDKGEVIAFSKLDKPLLELKSSTFTGKTFSVTETYGLQNSNAYVFTTVKDVSPGSWQVFDTDLDHRYYSGLDAAAITIAGKDPAKTYHLVTDSQSRIITENGSLGIVIRAPSKLLVREAAPGNKYKLFTNVSPQQPVNIDLSTALTSTMPELPVEGLPEYVAQISLYGYDDASPFRRYTFGDYTLMPNQTNKILYPGNAFDNYASFSSGSIGDFSFISYKKEALFDLTLLDQNISVSATHVAPRTMVLTSSGSFDYHSTYWFAETNGLRVDWEMFGPTGDAVKYEIPKIPLEILQVMGITADPQVELMDSPDVLCYDFEGVTTYDEVVTLLRAKNTWRYSYGDKDWKLQYRSLGSIPNNGGRYAQVTPTLPQRYAAQLPWLPRSDDKLLQLRSQ